MIWFFLFFVASGFAGLVYEVVWLRLAMASFGVTTPLVSIVLSVFMAGLAVGSLVVGRLARRLETQPRRALAWYAVAEAAIAGFALLVPPLLDAGRTFLATRSAVAWDSGTYYAASGAWIALTMLPACTAMGATFPLAMAAIRGSSSATPRSFSFLYLANVLGATTGTLAAAFVLVELLGFRATLLAAVAVNVAVAVAAFVRSRRLVAMPVASTVDAAPAEPRAATTTLVGLFLTGLVSMAMELVWIRQFTPYVGNVVYAFALILGTYLAATFLGSRLYRTWLGPDTSTRLAPLAWLAAGVCGLLPLAAADPRLELPSLIRLALGVAPVSAVVGLITPMLVDRWSGGAPHRAGAAYATNVVGSIAGPLVAAFWLLPWLGEHRAIVVLALPLFVVGAVATFWPALAGGTVRPGRRELAYTPLVAALAITLVVATHTYETLYPVRHVRRDHTATIIATGTGMNRDLQVNGTRTTNLTPITKWMAHLPLAFLDEKPTDALMICFGMGTTFRSLLAWDINVTAVELVPSVPDLFWYYHADALDVMRSPRGRIVIDDGRRFLERSRDRYDVITIDPPHPPEAAGSSLLYSREFYAIARGRLKPGGILQQWIPTTDVGTVASVVRAIRESFPHVRAFPIVNRRETIEVVGVHFLASEHPLPRRTAAELADRLPPPAARDLMEWPYAATPKDVFAAITGFEVPLEALIALAPRAPTLRDDRPYNEYFLLRRWVLPTAADAGAVTRRR